MKTGIFFKGLVVSLSSLLISSCGGGGGDSGLAIPAAPGQPKWTYMVYMAADNNLSEAAISDINEMEVVGSTDDVNVVVQVEYSTYHSDGAYAGGSPTTLRGKIRRDSDVSTVTSPLGSTGGNLDMGNPQTLQDFIVWAKRTYPADNYALVLWSHGSGWKVDRTVGGVSKGVLQDETSGSFMSLPGVIGAIENAGIHLDVLNFDACLMAMFEVVYAARNVTDFVVASEEVEPGDGDPYTTILAQLSIHPDLDGAGLSQAIVNQYRDFYAANRDGVTKSVIRTAGIEQLRLEINQLATYLNTNISSLRPIVQASRDSALSFTFRENKDLGDFLKILGASTANAALKSHIAETRAALSAVVVSNQFAPSTDGELGKSAGLAIFIPQVSEVSSADLSDYSGLPSSASASSGITWAQFVSVLTTGDTGSHQEDVNGNFSICVVWDNADVDLDLYIYEPRPDELYAPWMGTTTPNGFFSADSSVTQEAYECYASAEIVEKGSYDIFVNYFDGPAATTAEVYSLDESTGFEYALIGTAVLGVSNASPAGTYPIDDYDLLKTNPYSDWYFPGSETRSVYVRPPLAADRDKEAARKAFLKNRLLRKKFGNQGAPTESSGGKSS